MNPITDLDWRRLWIERDSLRQKPGNVEYWDDRARDQDTFRDLDTKSRYSDIFIEYLDLVAGETVFDMGCGNGGLAIPLAQAQHPVIACDFSAKMLDVLRQHCLDNDVSGIDIHQLSWTDDWEVLGIKAACVDVAIASRSLLVSDLWDAFLRLSQLARRKVAITIATDFGPRSTNKLGETVAGTTFLPDYIYAINMLFKMGYYPELRYIDSIKKDATGELRLIKWAYIAWETNSDSSPDSSSNLDL